MLEFQIDIEQLFSKNQLVPRIRAEFTDCKDFDFGVYMSKRNIDVDFGFDLLTQMILHKRAYLPALVGALKKHFEDNCQKTADALHRAIESELVNWSPTTRQFIVRFDISADVQAELDRYQFPMPMVVEPKVLEDNHDTGYYTSRNSVILRHNHHDYDVCLDHLNHINKSRFKLNQQVAAMVKNKWRNLDKPREDDEPGDYQKRVKAFEKYDRTTHDVLHHLGLANEGEFYLTHKYYKRGRTYCQGYHVNYMGNSWNKAVIELANEELIN